MHLTLINRRKLADIPSASGIELIEDKVFVIGDDSPWLFRLNDKFETVEKIQLTDTTPSGNKIPKASKPDLEAMCTIQLGNKNELLLFGSGSKSPERDILIRININNPHIVKKYSLVPFYENLRDATGLSKDDMNIEAAVVMDKNLYLFNRGKNTILQLNASEFISFIEGAGNIPSLKFFRITLPCLNGIEAGFSGATSTPDSQQIIFSASIEDTSNWIDDGEILGSFIGIFPVTTLKNSLTPTCIAITDTENNILKIKAESVAVHRLLSTNCLKLLLVTDNDGTTSELIEAELNF